MKANEILNDIQNRWHNVYWFSRMLINKMLADLDEEIRTIDDIYVLLNYFHNINLKQRLILNGKLL